MNSTHLSTWDQEEYVLGQRTPEMVRHLSQCSVCFSQVEKLERGVALFRDSAGTWSAERLEKLSGRPPVVTAGRSTTGPWVMAIAAALLLMILLPFSYRQIHAPKASQGQSAPTLSDDALLQQVDDEVSVEVPSSMEPLTHLVSASSTLDQSKIGGKPRAQTD